MRPSLLRCPLLSRAVHPLWDLLTTEERDEWQALANALQTYEVSHSLLPLDDSLLWLHLNMLWLRRGMSNAPENNLDISSDEDDSEDDESSDQDSPESSASNPDPPQEHSTPPFLFQNARSIEPHPIDPTRSPSIVHDSPTPPIPTETSHQTTGTVKTPSSMLSPPGEHRPLVRRLMPLFNMFTYPPSRYKVWRHRAPSNSRALATTTLKLKDRSRNQKISLPTEFSRTTILNTILSWFLDLTSLTLRSTLFQGSLSTVHYHPAL
jgi:hypothetical protein